MSGAMRARSTEQPSVAPLPVTAAAAPAAAPLRSLPSACGCPPPRQSSLHRANSARSSVGVQCCHSRPCSPAGRRTSLASCSATSGDGAEAADHRRTPSAALPPHRWAQQNVRISQHKRPGFACSLSAEARLPLPADTMFEVLTHPDAEGEHAGGRNKSSRFDGCRQARVAGGPAAWFPAASLSRGVAQCRMRAARCRSSRCAPPKVVSPLPCACCSRAAHTGAMHPPSSALGRRTEAGSGGGAGDE